MSNTEQLLGRLLESITAVLTPEVAQCIVDLQPDTYLQARVKELGEKADAGTLSEDERGEYRALADAGTLIAILKAKSRRCLHRPAN